MASLRRANPSQLLLYRWDPIFDSRRPLSDQHDTPFVDVMNHANTSSDFITCFMQAFDGDDSCHSVTDTVVEFCRGADLQSLQHDAQATTEPIALLDGSGGLTAWGLSEALKKLKKAGNGHIYLVQGRIYNGKPDDTPTRQPTKRTGELGRGIHLLYIATLNPWAVLALAQNASNHQAGAIAEFIFHHLQFDPRINAKILRDGLPVFALEFHFPYFALRKHRLPQRDGRRGSNGDPLRHYQDITFLRTMGPKLDNSETEYVYEAKMSCLVSGISRYSWRGYLFNDLYFEIDEDSECVAGFHEDQEDLGPRVDPLAAGKRPIYPLPGDPREYFLIIFEVRLRKVVKECQQVCVAVHNAIEAYRNDYIARAGRMTSHKDDSRKARSNIERQRSQLREELQDWMRQTIELLRRYIGVLNQYSEEWKAFRDTGCNYFMPTDDSRQSTRLCMSLAVIEQQVIEIGRLLVKFNHTKDSLCEDMPRELSLRMAHESNESALSSQNSARDAGKLAWIAFISLPVVLATGLLSTQQGYLPFEPSPWVLLVLVAIFEVLAWIIWVSFLGWNWKMKLKWRWHELTTRERDPDQLELEGLG